MILLNYSLFQQVDEEEKKFKAADENKDGFLDKSEFNAFYHPYSHEHMHHFEIDRTMHDNDKNKDGVLSMDEFIANGKSCFLHNPGIEDQGLSVNSGNFRTGVIGLATS